MKKFTFVPLAAIVALGACNDATTLVAPDSANFELVNVSERVAADQVNALVRLSFAIPFEVEVPGGGTGQLIPVAQPDGVALNFSGNQSNAGTCQAGTWKNKNGKGMGGTINKPHPHCTVWQDEGGTTTEMVNVVLEPISARYYRHNDNQWRLAFTNQSGDNGKVLVKDNEDLTGNGTIVAWAVFENNPEQRVGQITIALNQFMGQRDTDVCQVADSLAEISCLAKLISFSYSPIGVADGGYGEHGFGIPGDYVERGFLSWTPVGSGWYRND